MKWPDRPTCHQMADVLDVIWREPDLRHVDTCNCGYESVGTYGYPFRTCGYCGSIHPGDLAQYLQSERRAGAECLRCWSETIEEPQLEEAATQEQFKTWQRWSLGNHSPHTCSVSLSGSDWKYSYPHKFYVEGIPNPLAGQLVDITSESRSIDHPPTQEEIDEFKLDLSKQQDVVANIREPGWCPGMPADKFWNVCLHVKSPAPVYSHAKFYTQHLMDDGYDQEAQDLILKLVSERSRITFERVPDEETGLEKIVYRAPYFGYQRS